MKRILPLLGIALLSLLGGGLLLGRYLKGQAISPTVLPTLMVIPSDTPSDTPTETDTPTPTATFTPSPTPTFTPSDTPTATQTLATRVLVVTAIAPNLAQPTLVASADTATPLPLPTLNVPPPPPHVTLVPRVTSTDGAPPVGWFEYDITDPAITWKGKWDSFTATYRSANKHYLYSDDDGASMSLHFLGAAVRVRYVAYYAYGVFQVRIDGQVVATIDSYYPKSSDGYGNFLSTEIFALAYGWHTLDVERLGRQNPASAGEMIALDSVDVYFDGPEPTLTPTLPPTTPTFTPSPLPAQKVDLLIAPPTVVATSTPVAPRDVSVEMLIGYDANGNKVLDPDEGVSGIPIRIVAIGTNVVISSGVTNADGYARLEITTDVPVRVVVPYFNKFWDVPLGTTDLRITLLVPPANQPGLIP